MRCRTMTTIRRFRRRSECALDRLTHAPCRSLSPANAEIDVAHLKPAIEASVEADYPKLDALYKDIHAHPEVAFRR
jgi:hypothetical protein